MHAVVEPALQPLAGGRISYSVALSSPPVVSGDTGDKEDKGDMGATGPPGPSTTVTVVTNEQCPDADDCIACPGALQAVAGGPRCQFDSYVRKRERFGSNAWIVQCEFRSSGMLDKVKRVQVICIP